MNGFFYLQLLNHLLWLQTEKTYSSEYVHCLCAEPRRINNLFIEDGLKEVIFIFSLEGGVSWQHLIQQHPESPPINRGPIQHLLQDLWKHATTSFKLLWVGLVRCQWACTEEQMLRTAKKPFINADTQPWWEKKKFSNIRTQNILIPHYKNQARL